MAYPGHGEHTPPIDVPPTFIEAHRLDADVLARWWLDGWRRRLPAADDRAADSHLREVAGMAALAAWLTRWTPIHVHAALLAGATVQQAADAAGTTPAELFAAWSTWAAGQRNLRQRPGSTIGMVEAEHARVHAMFETAVRP